VNAAQSITNKPNHTLGRGEDAVFTHVRGLADLTGVSVMLQSIRTNPLEIIVILFLTVYGIQAFIARGSRRPREREIDQFPKAVNQGCLVRLFSGGSGIPSGANV